MIKKITIMLLGLWLLILLVGCSSYSKGDTTESTSLNNSQYKENSDYDTADNILLTKNTQSDRMIVKYAYVEIETDDSVTFYTEIINRARAVGGYESSYNINNYESYSVIEAEVRIPADKFDEIINYIRNTGMVINNRMNSEDITDDYFDTKTRLETTKATLKTYYNLLEKASTVEEIIQIQKTIDGITVELEAMEGKLNLWNSQVSLSTLNMFIRQHNDPIKIKKDINWNALSFNDMGYLITRGLNMTVDAIAVFIQWIIIAVVSLSPILVIAAAAYFILKKRKFKPKLPIAAKPSNTEKDEKEPNAEESDKKDKS